MHLQKQIYDVLSIYKKGYDIMNNKRRKQIDKAIEMLTETSNFIETIKSDEEEYMDNMPENLQGSSRYSDAEEACSCLEEAISDIESAIDNLNNASI